MLHGTGRAGVQLLADESTGEAGRAEMVKDTEKEKKAMKYMMEE